MAGQMLERASGLMAGPPGCCSCGKDIAEGGHVVDRDDDLELERLARAGIDDGDLTVGADATEEPGDRVEWPLRGGQADPLRGRGRLGVAEPVEAFEAESEMGAALRAGDRVHLVDDHVLDVAQDLAGLARQQEVQALGRGDEDVGRPAGDLPSVLAGRVAGPAGDGDRRSRIAELLGGESDAGEGRPEISLDVVGQRLERRDVEDTDVTGVLLGGSGAGVPGESVQREQERREGLAAAGRGMDERVLAPGDGLPAPRLGLGGRLETGFEPCADCG